MTVQSLRGTTDVLPEDMRRWEAIETTARRLATRYGYQELRTPLIEEAALFLRSVGETTDIVQKEMFRFTDRGGHDIVLRPEGTASIVRAYLEHHLHKTQGFAKLWYAGPMFRAERPQAGRLRQFHQFGVEAIGSQSPWVDVEVILLCLHILRECGVPSANTSLWIASMGCREDQRRSAQALRSRLIPHRSSLCRDCQARFEKNAFRILDCKNPTCHEMAWQEPAPFLCCDSCQRHFDTVRQGVQSAGVSFDDTKTFARGLDYYTRTVFEVRVKGLGAQDAVAAGGRYDHLVEELGGPSLGAVGCAAGMERVLLALAHTEIEPEGLTNRHGFYLAIAQPEAIGEGFRLLQGVRAQGIMAIMDYEGKSLRAQLREADKLHVHTLAVLGERELKEQQLQLKDLDQGTEEAVPLSAVAEALQRRFNTS